MSKVPEIAQGLLLDGLKGLSDSDLSTVSEGLRRLVGILGVEGMPPPLLLSPEVNVPGGKIGDPENRAGEAPMKITIRLVVSLVLVVALVAVAILLLPGAGRNGSA